MNATSCFLNLLFFSNKPKLTWYKTFQEHTVLMEVFHAEYELLFGFSNFGTNDNPFGNRPFSKSFEI